MQLPPAHILRIGEEIPQVDFSSLLDHSLFHQTIVWKHAADGDVTKAAEALHTMVEGQEDPVLKIGWAIQTWATIKNIEVRLALAPEFGIISPDYPGTIGLLVMRPLGHHYPNKDAFKEIKRELIRRVERTYPRKYPKFEEIMENFIL